MAEKYSLTLLAMHARVMPSIVLMDREIAAKAPEKNLLILILHEEEDALYAKEFGRLLQETHPQGVAGYRIQTQTAPYEKIKTASGAGAFYLLPAQTPKILQAVAWGIEQERITFSYDEQAVKEGVLASLSIGRKAVPYLNTDTLTKSKIRFNPTLISVAKRYPQ